MYLSKQINKAKFMAHNPTLIGNVAGYRFYEHPTEGDESPMIVIGHGLCGLSDYWDLPDITELDA